MASIQRHNVIILGSGRSGTSMVAGTLAGAGYAMGDDLVEPRATNPKGFFESREINAINEQIMASAVPKRSGAGELDQRHIPEPRQYWLAALDDDAPMSCDATIAEQIRQVCVHHSFCYKDPRFCYTLDTWRDFLPADTVFVCVFREPAVTAQSMLTEMATARYLSNMTMSFEQAVAVWVAMYQQVVNRLRHKGDWLFIHYKQMLTADGLQRLSDFTGAMLDKNFPEKTLQRTASKQPVCPEAVRLYEQLCELALF